jgi:hypothetical protein
VIGWIVKGAAVKRGLESAGGGWPIFQCPRVPM